MRHDIVHGDGPAKPIPNAEEHIAYLYSTQWFVLWVIHSRYGLKVDLERLFPALSSILPIPHPSRPQGASLPSP